MELETSSRKNTLAIEITQTTTSVVRFDELLTKNKRRLIALYINKAQRGNDYQSDMFHSSNCSSENEMEKKNRYSHIL